MQKSIVFFFLLASLKCAGQVNKYCDCDDYNALVLYESNKDSIDIFDDDNTQTAINCFLKFEYNREANSYWSEFTDPEEAWAYYSTLSVRNYFYEPSNQLVALYLISALYEKDFSFTRKIELIYTDEKGDKIRFSDLSKITEPNLVQRLYRKSVEGSSKLYYKPVNKKLMKRVYKLYREWVKEMNENGIQYLRENEIGPLSGSSFSWG